MLHVNAPKGAPVWWSGLWKRTEAHKIDDMRDKLRDPSEASKNTIHSESNDKRPETRSPRRASSKKHDTVSVGELTPSYTPGILEHLEC